MSAESATEQIKRRIAARHPLLLVVTHEEQRALDAIQHICDVAFDPTQAGASANSGSIDSIWVWSYAGMVGTWVEMWRRKRLANESLSTVDTGPNPVALFSKIESTKNALFILKDFTHFLCKPVDYPMARKLRDVASFVTSDPKSIRSIIIVDSERDLPARLEKFVYVVDFELPSKKEIQRIFADCVDYTVVPTITKEGKLFGKEGLAKMSEAAVGLTANEIEYALSVSMSVHGAIDIKALLHEKTNIIKKSGVLEYHDSEQDMASVGGLAPLKDWLRVRRRAFSEKAALASLPPPKAVMLVGVPGCGKSLVAKTIGKEWGMPVLRMDVGALFGSYVGQSESNMRKALKTAEAVAPCVLFIDEVEKGLSRSGGGQGGGDGGTSSRVFGNLLTWMNDKTAPVFVVMTANDISALPPEFLRKGRIDEIFFVDLPTAAERREILGIQLKKYSRAGVVVTDTLIERTNTFSGAELENVVVEGMYSAFDLDREMTADDLIAACDKVTTLAGTMPMQIKELRSWAKTRAVPASLPEVETAVEAATSSPPLRAGEKIGMARPMPNRPPR